MIQLDIRTLSFIATSMGILYAIGLISFGLSQKKYKGFPLLGGATLTYSMGLLLIGFRDVLPDWITIIAANTFVLIGMVWYLEAIRRFLGRANRAQPIGWIVLPIHIFVFILFTYYTPSVNARILSITLMLSLLSFLSAKEILSGLIQHEKLPRMMIGGVFFVYGLFQIFRFIWTLTEQPINSFMSAGTVHAFAFIFILILFSGMTYGFVWLVSKRLEKELLKLAHNDQLTGLLNRRGLSTRAETEFSRTERYGSALSIIMIDIDKFKKVNDDFGHYVGDQVLKKFAKLLKDNSRKIDIVGRLGGEEFIILLPQTNLDEAENLAERFRQILEDTVLECDGHQVKLTASLGVTLSSKDTKTLSQMAKIADRAMYEAKAQGGNRVHIFRQPIS